MLLNDNEIDFDLPELMGRINDLEAELAGRSCAYTGFSPLNKDIRQLPVRLESTDLEGWKNRDLTTLSGCWTLTGSEQEFVMVSCDSSVNENCPTVNSSNAIYCFNSEGFGSAKTQIKNNFCKADIKAKFNEDTSLVFNELTDQICPAGTTFSDGSAMGAIVSRSYTCDLTSDGKAECISKEDESGSRKKIILVRLKNE